MRSTCAEVSADAVIRIPVSKSVVKLSYVVSETDPGVSFDENYFYRYKIVGFPLHFYGEQIKH